MCEFDRSANRTPRFTVRALEESETDAALRLVWNVFVEFEAPDYGREGVDEFQKCLNDAGFLAGIRYYGAFCEENLIGVLGVRKLVAHVCFLFVDGAYHRRGVGT
ncbi:MAG: GNAT family N-acetyltransferase, partial [Thermoguttaceae bacterium]|nr:GNAT family N-acetyltransferase [Thermoguttaceae bacterium]